MKSHETFKNPPKRFRARTFWAWNGKLDAEELKRQIAVLDEMGFGGAYLHARTGLETEYLGEAWMHCVRVCAEEFYRRGMRAWLYDEDRWPSGSCGGKVTDNPAYRASYLTLAKAGEKGYAFDVAFEDGKAVSYQPLRGTAKHTKVVFAIREKEPEGTFNGNTYTDLMNPNATAAFLRLTHGKYAEALGDLFGDKIEGVFTDEPNRGAIFNGFAWRGEHPEARIPYTPTLFEAFEKQWGYRLEDKLPELYFHTEEFSEVAYHYCATITSLFLDNFLIPYANFCAEHNLRLTGHMLHEDNLCAIATLCGSTLRAYEQMDVPGMDNLTANNTCLPVPIMVRSAARQFGKKSALSEMYAGIGWQADFQTYKRVGDWQAMLGITDRCTHLSWYTMRGGAKRDYPASFLHQAVWHKEYALVEDYFARLNVFLGMGKETRELLVVHPNESAWGLSGYGAFESCFLPVREKLRALERIYFSVCESLVYGGIPFDYGDEEQMSRVGGVENGALRIGNETYRRVLVAGNVTMRKSTVNLLNELMATGGEVILCGNSPEYLDGAPCNVASLLKGAVRLQENELAAHFEQPFTASGGKCFTRFAWDADKIVFAAVSAEREEREVCFRIKGEYRAEKWDARTGETASFPLEYENGDTVIRRMLAPSEELLLVMESGRGEVFRAEEKRWEALFASCDYSLKEPNVCVLDHATCVLDGKKICTDEVLRIDRAVREKLKLPHRNPEGLQPWYRAKKDQKIRPHSVSLRFTFNVETLPKQLFLMADGEFDVQLNGAKLPKKWERCEQDICFCKMFIDISRLRKGENELVLGIEFTEDTDLENVYLLGDFGVRLDDNRPVLISLPKKLDLGDISGQGLPFYAGEISYRFPLPAGDYEAEIGYRGALAKVGSAPVPFAPFRANVSTNDALEVRVTVTQRNMFGPLHFTPPEDSLGAFEDFYPNEKYTKNYALIEQGLESVRVRRIGEERE